MVGMVGMVGWIYIFSVYGQIITEIKQGTFRRPVFLAIYPDLGNLNVSISSHI